MEWRCPKVKFDKDLVWQKKERLRPQFHSVANLTTNRGEHVLNAGSLWKVKGKKRRI